MQGIRTSMSLLLIGIIRLVSVSAINYQVQIQWMAAFNVSLRRVVLLYG